MPHTLLELEENIRLEITAIDMHLTESYGQYEKTNSQL
jgi:hypothetical protein